jgi:hypothetical protein
MQLCLYIYIYICIQLHTLLCYSCTYDCYEIALKMKHKFCTTWGTAVPLSQCKILGVRLKKGSTRWRSWLRHCATSRKIAGWNPDGVTGNFHWHNPSSCTMALGLTQPLKEMSTRNISWWVKAASVYGWQPYHIRVRTVMKSGSLNLPEPSVPVQACNGIALPFCLKNTNDCENVKYNNQVQYVLKK